MSQKHKENRLISVYNVAPPSSIHTKRDGFSIWRGLSGFVFITIACGGAFCLLISKRDDKKERWKKWEEEEEEEEEETPSASTPASPPLSTTLTGAALLKEYSEMSQRFLHSGFNVQSIASQRPKYAFVAGRQGIMFFFFA